MKNETETNLSSLLHLQMALATISLKPLLRTGTGLPLVAQMVKNPSAIPLLGIYNKETRTERDTWTPEVGDGQGGLACCFSWGRKDSDTTEKLN